MAVNIFTAFDDYLIMYKGQLSITQRLDCTTAEKQREKEG
jgi:hypothetical protein